MKKLLAVLGTTIVLLSLAACGKSESTSKDSSSSEAKSSSMLKEKENSSKKESKKRESSKKESIKKESGEKAKAISESKAESISAAKASSIAAESSDKAANAMTAIRNELAKGFVLSPKLFNGMDVDKAMEKSGAPQNIVSDYTKVGYVKNDSTIRMEQMRSAFDVKYTITETYVVIDGSTIPYTTQGTGVTFGSWTEPHGKDVITMNLRTESGAKSIVDSVMTQN
ncbi:hypothetical protein [Dellaglioa algida]|uniref:hypothetical protein n=1 Tax=Dellaglioa algida TaxID=105612 RepID=UPI0024C4E1B6|nr:hypothetical protein [Dellaglioa algida]MDK1727833.1 hypothetical protein [Dellaglioa algida]MDK1735041.1 hypothetical protein [Dellaglioa algida]MDK1737155.1 hypothetical protein [Dellaglioa algida]